MQPIIVFRPAARLPSRRRIHAALALCGTILASASIGGALAQSVGSGTTSSGPAAAALSGAPVQVIPYVNEPGAPEISIAPGTLNPLAGDDGSNTGSGSGSSGSVGGNVGDADVIATMLGTDYGAAAVANAQSVNVNPAALAATCVMETTTCTSSTSGGSGAQGPFQMYPAAYQEGLATALAANPSLASQIVQGSAGMNDPTTEAIAASGYLMQAAQSLQNAGISDPTVLQARSYYNFGPTYGPQVAQAGSDVAMSSLLPASYLSQNGISANETVGQWNASVAAKIGNAANQSVLT